MGILEYGRQIGMTQQQKNGGAAPPPAPCTNLIYYGPPGTGKTYKLNEILEHEYAQTNVSPEEWRNRFIAEKITTLKWWESAAAVLYDLGGEADVTQMTRHPFIQAIAKTKSSRNLRTTLWGVLQHHAIEGSIVATRNRAAPAVFDKNASSVWKLAGDWEDACADLIALVDEFKRGPQEASVIQRYRFVTFHQSYGYKNLFKVCPWVRKARPRAACGVANPRWATRPICGLRLAAHPDPHFRPSRPDSEQVPRNLSRDCALY